eukprot:3975485-Amphidinium_carterae.1
MGNALLSSYLREPQRSHVPYYYSTAGYGALGVVDKLAGNSKQNAFPATYMVQPKRRQYIRDQNDYDIGNAVFDVT